MNKKAGTKPNSLSSLFQKGPVDVHAPACEGHKADVQGLQMKL